MIFILTERATPEQVAEMLKPFGTYIKLAVDVERELVAAGGDLHYDCEQALLDDGSRQADVWGADWDPVGEVRFESLINIRPSVAVAQPQGKSLFQLNIRTASSGSSSLPKPILRKFAT